MLNNFLNILKKIKEIKELNKKINDIRSKNLRRVKKIKKLKTKTKRVRENPRVFMRVVQKRNNTFVHFSYTNIRSKHESIVTPNILSIRNSKKIIRGKKSNNFLQKKLFKNLIKYIALNRNQNNYLVLSNTDKTLNNLIKNRIHKYNFNKKIFFKIKWNIKKAYN